MDKELIRDYELDIIVKAWRDEAFRKKLLSNPKKAIEDEFELSIPDDMSISVHEESEHDIHLIVPSVPSQFSSEEFSDEELKDVIGGVIATGHLGAFPKHDERAKIRELKKENDSLQKMIEKLENDLDALEKQLMHR